jgi:hypothetical protein
VSREGCTGAEEGRSVVPAAPSLRPSAERKRLRRSFLDAGTKVPAYLMKDCVGMCERVPFLSWDSEGDLGRQAHISKARCGAPGLEFLSRASGAKKCRSVGDAGVVAEYSNSH